MSEPGYIELQSASQRMRDYARGVREGGCPECGHDSLIVTEALVATRVDPACWAGRCQCIDWFRDRQKHGLIPCGICLAVHDPGLCDEPVTDETCGCSCHCGCADET